MTKAAAEVVSYFALLSTRWRLQTLRPKNFGGSRFDCERGVKRQEERRNRHDPFAEPPIRGIDVGAKAQIHKMIDRIAKWDRHTHDH